MTNRFDGKVAIVTGGTSGIGKAIVEGLVKEGAKVAVAARREEILESMEKEYDGKVIGVKTDVTSNTDHENLVKKTIGKFGKLDAAFNVAGGSKNGTIADISEEDWMWTIDLCLKGTFLGMKNQIKQMKDSGGGSIVNISSLNSEVPMWGGSAYAAAKAAVTMLTKNAVLEYAEDNMRFNALLPGLIKTPLTDGFTGAKEVSDAFMERIPERRTGEPEEMAKAALFLASDEASYINGAALIADGGWSTTGYPDLSKFM